VEVDPQWTHVTVEVARLDDLGTVADVMERHELTVNRRYVEAIERLRRTIGPLERILVLVVVVIGLVVTVNLVLTTWQRLQQRKYEIGILKAGGMKTRSVVAVFVGEAFAIGLATGLAGVALGYLLGTAVSSRVASGWFVFTPWMGAIVLAGALAITVLACLLGTFWIARRRPVELLVR
jgi:putative ABC transport system permease protein